MLVLFFTSILVEWQDVVEFDLFGRPTSPAPFPIFLEILLFERRPRGRPPSQEIVFSLEGVFQVSEELHPSMMTEFC